MYKQLKDINSRPKPFEFYTAEDLWTDEYTATQMLEYHLNEAIDVSSRNKHFIDQSVAWIASEFQINRTTTIADFGCGPGLYTTRFAELGAKVTGVDFSENSLTFAKQTAKAKNLEINYVCQNYLKFETQQKFDLITMIMCDFCALSPEQRHTMLLKFETFLEAEGALLLDVYSLAGFAQKQESSHYELNQLNGFWSAQDYYCFVNNFKYEQEKVTLDKYTIIEKDRERTVFNWLQYFDENSLQQEFERAGLRIETLYADVAGTSYRADSEEFAVIARKR